MSFFSGRRSGLVLAFTLAALLVPARAGRAGLDPDREARLRLFNTHTGERVDVVYRRGAAYDDAALARLEDCLRDFRTGDRHPLDPRLFDLLSSLAGSLGNPDGEFHVISGFRSPRTNEMLRTTRTGVARHSLHMEGQAIDVRMPGVKTGKLRDVALDMARGGVGYYASSDFVHVDTGRVRRW
jgi:uncharacterized protein YcbK (DUF882 family)